MATATKLSSGMQLKYSMGVNGDGKEIFKKKTFKNFKPDALDDDIYEVSQLFASIQEPSVDEVKRIDESLIEA